MSDQIVLPTATAGTRLSGLESLRPFEGWRSVVPFFILAALLIAGAAGPYFLAERTHSVVTIWPSAGILLGAVLLSPRRLWSWLLGTGFLVLSGLTLVLYQVGVLQAVASGAGSVAQCLLGVWLVRRTTGDRTPDMGRLRDLTSVIAAALLAPLAKCLILQTLAFTHPGAGLAGVSFSVWWAAHALGIAVLTPFLITWAAPREQARPRTWLGWIELGAAFLGLCLAAQLIFGDFPKGQDLVLTFPFFTIPFLFWIAMRFGLRASTLAALLLTLIVIVNTARGTGPLPSVAALGSEQAFILQIFLGVSILSSLLLAASMTDRRRTEAEILTLNLNLEERVRERTSALEASEQRFQALAEAAPVGIFATDSEGVCTYVNDRWCEFTQQSAERSIGQNWLEVIDPRDREAMQRKWERTRLEDERMEGEFRLRSRDGRTKWVFAQAAPDRSDPGQRAFIGTVTDISERKIAESATDKAREQLEERVKDRTKELSRALAQIRDSEARTRAVIDSASDAFIAVDQDGNITDWNPEAGATFGHEREDVAGRPLVDVILPGEGADRLRIAFAQLFSSGAGALLRHQTEFQAIRQNGESFPAEMTVSLAGDSNPRRYSIFLRDITARKLAEDAVRESESVLRSFFDSTPMMMGLVELLSDDVLNVSANTAAARFYGKSPAEMAGQRSSDLGLNASTRRLWVGHYRESQETGTPKHFEWRLDTENGPRQLSVTVCFATQGPRGRPQFAYAAEDITDRRLAAEDLREKTEALENAAEGVARVDSQGRIMSVNKAFSDLTGYLTEDLIGQEWLCTTHPEDRAQMKVAYQTMLAQGKAEQEVRGLHKDGANLFQQQVIVSTYDHSGSFIGHYCFVRDITSRARAEAERDGYFTLSLDMLCIAGFNGYFRRLNPAFERVLGFSIAELQAAPLVHFVHPDDREKTEELFARMVAGEEAIGFENRYRCKDGSYRWFSWTARPFSEEQIIYAVAHDVTEQKRAAEEIIASLEEKDVLLKEIHHRVKNNLQVISSLLQLQSGYIKDPKTLETFRESQNRIRSMAMIHEKLYQTESLARIDFEEYATSLAAMLIRSYATTSGIKLKTAIEKVDLNLDVAIPIGLITNELLSNAMKYAFPGDRGGTVTVALKKLETGRFQLAISDDGVGLPEGLQVEKAKSLGLRLVRILTGQIGGELNFASKEGRTTFTVTFSDGD